MKKINRAFTPLQIAGELFKVKFVTGFSLLELMIVVIIIGILASLAIPRYQKSVESARGAEAFANLSILRGAELRYFGEHDRETNVFNDLDVENPQNNPNTYFDYGMMGNAAPDSDGIFCLGAYRKPGGMYGGRWIYMDQNGNIAGDWPFLP